jgi:hypothetical protein
LISTLFKELLNSKYSVILGNPGNTKDRFCGGYKDNPPTLEMLKRAASIPDVTGIELVGTWGIRKDIALYLEGLFHAGYEGVCLHPCDGY